MLGEGVEQRCRIVGGGKYIFSKARASTSKLTIIFFTQCALFIVHSMESKQIDPEKYVLQVLTPFTVHAVKLPSAASPVTFLLVILQSHHFQ